MELFKLVGKVFVDSKEAQDSISKTGSKAEMLKNSLVGGVATAAKFAAGVTAAATTVGTTMVVLAKKTAAGTDEIDKMSQRLGITRKAYQELDYVLSQSGVEVNSFQTGMKTLLANMDRVTEGNKTAIKNFDMLGVSVLNADGTMRGQEETLYDVISAFQHMENGAEKSRLAQELFGKQGQEIIPLLNSEAGSFEKLTQAANNMGLVLSDEAINAGVDFTDMMDNVTRQIGALKMSLFSELMPYIVDIVKWISDNLPAITEAVKSVAQSVMPIVMPVIKAVLAAMQAMFALINGDFEGFSDAIQQVLVNLGDALYQLGKNAIQFLWDGMKSVWASISDWVSEKVNWLANKLAFWKSGTSQMDDAAYGGAYSSYSTTNSRTSNTTQASQNINISLDLDGATLARKTYNYNQAESRRRGGNLVTA